MNNEFLIVKNMKLFINSLDGIIIPNRDRNLKYKMYNTCYEVLFLLYRANLEKNKKDYIKDIISNISMIDFYLERCLKNKYISSKVCERKTRELINITKMIYGWAKYESGCK